LPNHDIAIYQTEKVRSMEESDYMLEKLAQGLSKNSYPINLTKVELLTA